MTVPELRFVLRDRGRPAWEAVEVEDSERKCSRERRGCSSELGEGDDVDVGDELVPPGERLVGDRDREVRIRANRVVSAVGDLESAVRGVAGPEHVVLVVEWNIDCDVEDEPENDRVGHSGLASG
ncbi:hypothetical protein MMC32_004765 [Xylographa parallela]|nr:hypothetical protein [Xylographa parallela]